VPVYSRDGLLLNTGRDDLMLSRFLRQDSGRPSVRGVCGGSQPVATPSLSAPINTYSSQREQKDLLRLCKDYTYFNDESQPGMEFFKMSPGRVRVWIDNSFKKHLFWSKRLFLLSKTVSAACTKRQADIE